MGGTMDHPGEAQLQRYLDGELDEQAEESVRCHLQACAPCRLEHARYAHLSEMVRSSCPEPGTFVSDGEFWVRIAARITARRTPRWPLVPLLPPFLLAGLGLALEAAFTLVVAAFGLTALGVLPSPATLLSEKLPELLGSPLLEDTLFAWLGLSGEEIVRAAAARWQALSVAAQHGILLGAPVAALIAALSAVEVLYVAWAMCWPEAAGRKTEGEH